MTNDLCFPPSRRLIPPSTGRGERVYVIGDVHGRFDLLVRLIDRLREDSLGRTKMSGRLIILGDFIDRGDQSREVVNLLWSLRSNSRVIVLLGNHEAAMLDCLAGNQEVCDAWLSFGGDATLRSYGVDPPHTGEDVHDFVTRLAPAIGEPVIDWLRDLPLTATSGSYFFCHAGIRPDVSLKRQSADDLLWIRADFLDSPRIHRAIIVHGHSIVDQITVLPNRIAVDTGAYRTGKLMALGLERTRLWAVSSD